MKEFTITTELINQVLEYLGSRPWAETNQLISAIHGEYEREQNKVLAKEPATKYKSLGKEKVKNIE